MGFAVLDGCDLWIANSWVANSWAVLCGARLRLLGSAIKTETRDERQRRESQIKYYYFFTIIATVQFYV